MLKVLWGKISPAVGICVLAWNGVACAPTYAHVVVRNDSRHPVKAVSVSVYSDEMKAYGRLEVGAIWNTSFKVDGDTDYQVVVTREDGSSYGSKVGYLTHGAAFWDTLSIRDSVVDLIRGDVTARD
jgi:hypothetical protein